MTSTDLLMRELDGACKVKLNADEERRLHEIMTRAKAAIELFDEAEKLDTDFASAYRTARERWSTAFENARKKLFEASVKWAIKIAHRYRRVCKIPLDDLVQEALIGALRGVEKFDPDRGRLSTVVHWWVMQQLLKVQSQHHGVIRIAQTAFYKKAYESCLEKTRKKADRIRRGVRSLDLVYGDDGHTIAESLKDSRSPDIVDLVDTKLRAEQIRGYLNRLPQHYQEIVVKRSEDKTLLEIAEELNISRERVRQLEERAYKLLIRWSLEENNDELAAQRLLAKGEHFVVDHRRIDYDERKRMELIEPFLSRLSEDDRWFITQRASGKTHNQMRELLGCRADISSREHRIMSQLREWYFAEKECA